MLLDRSLMSRWVGGGRLIPARGGSLLLGPALHHHDRLLHQRTQDLLAVLDREDFGLGHDERAARPHESAIMPTTPPFADAVGEIRVWCEAHGFPMGMLNAKPDGDPRNAKGLAPRES